MNEQSQRIVVNKLTHQIRYEENDEKSVVLIIEPIPDQQELPLGFVRVV